MAEESETDRLYNLLDGYVNRGEDLTGIGFLIQRNPTQKILKHLLSIKNESGFTAIHKAVEEHATIRLDYLLQRLNANQRFELLKTQDNMGWSPIHHAATDGRIDTFKFLLEPQTCDQTFALLRIQNKEGFTAIHEASIKDNASAMKYMLGKVEERRRICILLHIPNNDDNTAVFEGIRKDHIETVSCMLECVATSARCGLLRKVLHCVALEGQKSVIAGLSKLIDSDKLFNLMTEKNERRQMPIHSAMLWGHTEVVEAMLNLVNEHNNNKCMKLLTALDNDANTPIHCAAAGGHTNALELALSFLNADQMQQLLEMRNKRGHTAIDTAVVHGHEETFDYLKQYFSTLDPGYEYNQDVEMGEPTVSQDLTNQQLAALAEKVAELEKKQTKTDERQERTEKRLETLERNSQNLSEVQHTQSQSSCREVPTDVEMGEPDVSQDLANQQLVTLAEKVAELEKKQTKTDDRQERTEKRLDISETNSQNLRKEQHTQSQRLEDLEENVVYRELPTGGQQNTDSLCPSVMEEGVPDDADEDNM